MRGMLLRWVLGPRLPGALVVGSVCPMGSCSLSAHLLLSPGTGCHVKQGFLIGFEMPTCVGPQRWAQLFCN